MYSVLVIFGFCVCFTDCKGCPDMYFEAKILFMNNDEIERK